ncbi:MAG: hypothetical protein K2M17_01355, partial [Bacilli bacterium]|nr:hypothetical protein [Bacilli bacterium]
HNKKQNSLYMLSEGIITAYGVISIEKFLEMTKSLDEKVLDKLENYYKKDFRIEEKQVISPKLTNKKRIEKYYKNQKLKEFTKKEFESLGELNYHHNIKSYKKLIKMLKNNYVFKNSDIMYIDKVIVIPYLYNSLNEEEKANKDLEETIIKLFEFKGDKLKQKMLEEIKNVRDYFPIWEYRGYSKNEVK